MFSPHLQPHDPYHYFRLPLFSFPHHAYASSHPPHANTHIYQPPKPSRCHAPSTQKPRQTPTYAPKPHHSAFNIDISDYSEQSDFDQYLDTDASSTRNNRLHTSRSYFHDEPKPEPDFDLASQFERMQIRVPKRAANEMRSDRILILPSTLVHLKITTFTDYGKQSVHAAVVGDMRLRDVVEQTLPQECVQDARAFVKSRGEWIEPVARTKVSDVVELGRFAMNAKREFEVRFLVKGVGNRRKTEKKSKNGRSDGMGRHGGWDRERGRAENMRVY